MKIIKDTKTSVRMNNRIKKELKKNGITAQSIVDKFISNECQDIVKKVKIEYAKD